VLGAVDVAGGTVQLPIQAEALSCRETAVTLRDALVAPDLALLDPKPARLPGGDLAAHNSPVDPVLLAVLAPVEDRRGSLGRSSGECGSGKYRNGQERDLSHGYVS
jgi:hypothetical protein